MSYDEKTLKAIEYGALAFLEPLPTALDQAVRNEYLDAAVHAADNEVHYHVWALMLIGKMDAALEYLRSHLAPEQEMEGDEYAEHRTWGL